MFTLRSAFHPPVFSTTFRNVHRLYLRYLVENLPGLVSKTRPVAHLRECLPQNIGQKTHQDMRLDTLCLLVPYWTDRQIAFVDPKRSLGLP